MKQLNEDIKNLTAMNMKAISKQYSAMVSALQVIHTWAAFDLDSMGYAPTLTPEHTLKLCESALRRFKAFAPKEGK